MNVFDFGSIFQFFGLYLQLEMLGVLLFCKVLMVYVLPVCMIGVGSFKDVLKLDA